MSLCIMLYLYTNLLYFIVESHPMTSEFTYRCIDAKPGDTM